MAEQDILLAVWAIAILVGFILLVNERERHKENMRKAEEKSRQEALRIRESGRAYAKTVTEVMAVLKKQNDEREKQGLQRLFDIGVRI